MFSQSGKTESLYSLVDSFRHDVHKYNKGLIPEKLIKSYPKKILEVFNQEPRLIQKNHSFVF